MSTRFCTYCHLKKATDREHVFPASWYPGNTPATVQRLTVPACHSCNSRWQRVEESVGHDLLMICDDKHPDIAGVLERITNGWDAARAKDPKDAEFRQRRAKGILQSTRWVAARDDSPQVPFIGADGAVVNASPAREIDPTSLNALAEKFVRGLYFAEGKGDLALDTGVRAILVPNDSIKAVPREPPLDYPESMVRLVNSLPINDRMRPGFLYRWAQASTGSLWCFQLWGHITILAVSQRALIAPAR